MFEEIKVSWGGQNYLIAPNRVLGAIASVEEHITMVELMRHVAANTTPIARMAFAHAALLNYAGVKVTGDEVYEWLVSDPNELLNLTTCLNGLLMLMMPPSMRGAPSEETRPPMPTTKRKDVARLSRKATKR